MSKKKKQSRKSLSTNLTRSVSVTGKSVVTAILDRFPQRSTKPGEPTTHYSELSIAQKTALHDAVKNSIIDRSLTASGAREKKGVVDALTESPQKAATELNVAYQFMRNLAEARIPLSMEILLELHQLALPHLPKQNRGIRNHPMGKPNAFFAHPNDIEPLLNNLITFINNPPEGMGWSIVESIAQSIFLSAHPFRDGNGRINRLMVAYMAFLHDKIPPVFTDPKQEIRYGIFSSVSPEGIKNAQNVLGFKEGGTSGVTPTNLSPECIKQFEQAGAHLPNWQLPTGKVVTHAGLHADEGQKILASTKNNRKIALDTIRTVKPSVTSSEKVPSPTPKTQLIEYFLETPRVLNSPTGRKLKTAIIADLIAKGAKTQPGAISAAVSIQVSDLLNSLLPSYVQAQSVVNNNKLNIAIHQLNFLRKWIVNNQAMLTETDRQHLATFHQEIQGFLPRLESLANFPDKSIVETWHVVKNLAQMCVDIGSPDTCSPSEFRRVYDAKLGQCSADGLVKGKLSSESMPKSIDSPIQPDPIETSQSVSTPQSTQLPSSVDSNDSNLMLLATMREGLRQLRTWFNQPTAKKSPLTLDQQQESATLIRQMKNTLTAITHQLPQLSSAEREDVLFSLNTQRDMLDDLANDLAKGKPLDIEALNELADNVVELEHEFSEQQGQQNPWDFQLKQPRCRFFQLPVITPPPQNSPPPQALPGGKTIPLIKPRLK